MTSYLADFWDQWSPTTVRNLVILAKNHSRETLPEEAVGGVIFGPFSNVNNFRPAIYNDVISCVVVNQPMGVKVSVKFGDSRSNRSRDKRLPHFVKNDYNDDDARRRTL